MNKIDFMPLTSTHMSLLLEIQRTGSLARAALNLDVTPPAVSQQLAKLERDLGATLVDRGARGARLSPLGLRLVVHAERVATELAAADETAAEFLGIHRSRLRVGGPPSLSMTLLPEVLASVRYRHPHARLSVIDIMSDAGADLVASGTLDLALCATYTRAARPRDLRFHDLMADPLAIVLPDDHRLADGSEEPIPLEALADEDWVSGPPGRPSRVQLDDAAAEAGFVPRVPFTTESYDVAQSLADAGVAVAFVPRLALNPRFRTVVRGLSVPRARQISAVVPSDLEHIPLAVEFLRDLAQVASSGALS